MTEDIKFEIIKKISEFNFKKRDLKDILSLDSVSPPSVFVGSKLKYPSMNVGILSPLKGDEDAWIYDSPEYWAENNFEIRDVLQLRDNLLNSRFKVQAKVAGFNKKFFQTAQEIAIASKPVDIEIELKKKLNFGRKKDKILTGYGMRAELKKAKITNNVKVDWKVDKVINDEIKAAEGIDYLYKNNFSEYVLSKILSVGVLGLKKNKKLVPTRWSITATDDMIAKKLLEKIRNYKITENYEFFFGNFLGNCYLILFFPNIWSYELFELYFPGSSWNPSKDVKASTDFESFSGRKDYASATAGGYYASRLPILQYLEKTKKQASILVIRLETPSYWAALGVWVVRESVKKAMQNQSMNFQSKDELIQSVRKIGKIKYDFDCGLILKKSKLLNQINTQKSLNEWI